MDSSGPLFQPSQLQPPVNVDPRVQETEAGAAARTRGSQGASPRHRATAAPLWKREGGSSTGGEDQACRAVPGLGSKHGGSGSRRGRWQPAGPRSGDRGTAELAKQGTRTGAVLGKKGAQGQARDWVQSPALDGWWGSGHGSTRLWGSHHLLNLQKGLGRPDPRTQSWAQSRAASWAPSGAGETCLPGCRGGVPLNLATRRHLTWDLVQELVGCARQDPDPVQLWHQVGVLIQDKPALPAKGSREARCSGCSPALLRAGPSDAEERPPGAPVPPRLTTPLSVERARDQHLGGTGIPPPTAALALGESGRDLGRDSAPSRGGFGGSQHHRCSRSRGGVGSPQQEGSEKGAGEADRRGFRCCTGLGWPGPGSGDREKTAEERKKFSLL